MYLGTSLRQYVHFATGDCDHGANRFLVELAEPERPHAAVAERGEESVLVLVAERRERELAVVGQHVRLVPRHRLAGLDDHERVRRAVRDLGELRAALAL